MRALAPVLILSSAWPMIAQAQPITGDTAVSMAEQEGSKLPPDTFGGELMAGKIGEDVFLNLALRLSFDREMWGVGLGLPLRFRLIDNDPKNDGDLIGLREQDWDEFTDFLKVIRYVYFGKRDKTGPFYVRLGELSGLSIGHGTIVHRYQNTIDLDHWRLGTNVAVNIGAFGGEAVVGDLATVEDPVLAGLRLTVRPLQLAMGEGLWDRFVVGASVMTDPTAPLDLATSPDPERPGAFLIQRSDDNVPVVTRERALGIFGVDLGYELLRGEPLSITPYTDLNHINQVDNGWGLHVGILWALRVPAVVDTLTVDLRTEYRRVSGDYQGPYFTTAYDIERFVYTPGAPVPLTKLGAMRQGGSGKNGVFFDLLAGFPSFVYVGGEFIDYDGGLNDGQVRLSLEVPALEFVQFSAFYYRINISGLDDLFELDDRSAIVAQVSIPVYMFLSLRARWWRVWQATAAGGFEAVDDWSVGLGFNFEL